MANVVRRYQRVVSISVAEISKFLPAGSFISSSVPEPGELIDITVSNTLPNYAVDLNEIMAFKGFQFVSEAPVTTLEAAAAAEIPPINRIRELGGTELSIGAVSNGQNLQRSGTSIIGVAPGGGGSSDMRDIFVFDHFMSGNVDTDEMGLMGWRQYATGTGNNIAFSGQAGRPGVLILSGGTALAARAGIALGETATGGKIFLGGSGEIGLEFLFKFPAASDFSILNLERINFGFGLDWAADAELPDFLGVRYAPAAPTLDTAWMIVAANGGARTAVSSAVVPVANTWQRIKVRFMSGTATLSINGSNVATVNTNIPVAGLGVGMIMYSLGSGTNVNGHFDYILGTQVTDKEGL